jgi:alpha-galactosidase
MPDKKIACLGAGSAYFAGALADLVIAKGLEGSEVALYDIDVEKAEVIQRHGARLAELAGTGFRVRTCTHLADALDGADFAVTAIGGAGESAGSIYDTGYHAQDVTIPARYGIYQIVGDTGGPAGMMMGLRSVPIYLNICREMEKRCPKAILFNHSNPMAVLCRAMTKYSGITVVGICHGVQGGIERLAKLLGVRPEELDTVWIGTNHYHWFTRIYHHGKDVYPEVWKRLAERTHPEEEQMTQKLSQIYGYKIVYPKDDHALEFYPFLAQVPDGDHLPYEQKMWVNLHAEALPGAPVAETETEHKARKLAKLKEIEAELAQITLPDPSVSRFAGEELGTLLGAIAQGQRHVHVVNIPNKGVVPNLPDYAVLEVEGVTDSCGVRGIHTGEAPISLMGLLQRRIAWQELVADAAVKGDRSLALQALLLDDMAIRPEPAEAMLDELLASSKAMLPQFI